MKQGGIFTKTRRDAPKDETSNSAKLLIKGGFIHKEMAGVYSLLPLGLRVIKKIENIIREEMNKLGANEVLMTTLQDPEIWNKTGRWSDDVIDNWFKTKLKNDNELGLGLSHEEPMVNIMLDHLNSYKDLPVYSYQIQTKFRNELRAKSGIMRGREFLMKDLYSFSEDIAQHDQFYEKVKIAYQKIFDRCGIGHKTFLTFASGGIFSKFSHEFQTICDVGEDTIYLDQKKSLAVNKEVLSDETLESLSIDKNDLVEVKSIEVANIFSLGTRFSDGIGLQVDSQTGEKFSPIMGCYGIGVTRLMGVVAEINSDENSIQWPLSVAPFQVHLLNLLTDDADSTQRSQKIYDKLMEEGIEVLLDDRNVSSGVKFADADLVGIPYRIVVGKKSAALPEEKVMVSKYRGDEQEGDLKDVIAEIKDEKK